MINRPKLISKKRRYQIAGTSIQGQNTDYDKIMLILEYGVLAPSTHNTQPWKFQVENNNLIIYIDCSKHIPEADPTYRNMYISIGALITNIVMAAQQFSVNAKVNFVKKLKGSETICSIAFDGVEQAADPTHRKILDSILWRQNYRGFFKPQIRRTTLSSINNLLRNNKNIDGRLVKDPEQIHYLGLLTSKGLKLAYANPAFRSEISSYINHNLSSKKYGLHGYSLRMNFPLSVLLPKIMKKRDIGSKLANLNFKSFTSAPALVVLSTEKDSEDSWITVGMLMEEVMITLAAQETTSSIYSACVEMGDLRQRLIDFLKLGSKKPQVVFCIGEPKTTLPYSVRKEPEEFLVKVT